MQNFFYHIPTKVSFGIGTLMNLPAFIKEYGNTVLLVYGGGSIKKTGLYDQLMLLFQDNKIEYKELAGVEPNPRLSTVKKGVELCRKSKIDAVIAVGGGSVIDCAKAIAASVFYDGDPWELVQDGEKIDQVLPIITVSTMSGTGSEMDPYAVITNEDTMQKMDLYSEKLYPSYSILDPELTFTVSAYQTAVGVVDIMSHVFEVYFANVEDTYFQDRIMEAILKVLIHYGPIACKEPHNYDARSNIMWASEWAINGMIACGKQGPWPAHSIEHQLSAYYDLTHGHGLAIILPSLMEYILDEKSLPRFKSYGTQVLGIDDSLPEMEIAYKAINMTKDFFKSLGLSLSLKEAGVLDQTKFEEMAAQASQESMDECLVPLTKKDIMNIYEKCFEQQ